MAKTRETLTDREWKLVEVAVHESGHAVIGVLCGGRLRASSVTGGFTRGEITGRTTFDDLPAGLDPHIAYAGVWAQSRWNMVVDPRNPRCSRCWRPTVTVMTRCWRPLAVPPRA